jgi:hypothetical protein
MSLEDYFHLVHNGTVDERSSLASLLHLENATHAIATLDHKSQAASSSLSVLDAVFARTHGIGVGRYGIFEASREEYRWKYGSENYRLSGNFSELITTLTSALVSHGVDVKLSWKATHVEWEGETAASSSPPSSFPPSSLPNDLGRNRNDLAYLKCQPQRRPKVCVRNEGGDVITASSAILCVPHSILLQREIQFEPSLPEWKTHAIGAVQMGSAVKVVARFKQRFWSLSGPDATDPSLLFCPDAPFSQIWFDIREDVENGIVVVVAVGFQTGDTAERLMNRSDTVLETIFVRQLDDIFGDFGPGKDSNPASKLHQCSSVYHWGKNPFVKGGYSSPTPGSGWGWVWKRQAQMGMTHAEQREDTMRSKVHAQFSLNLLNSSLCGNREEGLASIAMLTGRKHLYQRTARHDLAANVADRLFFAGEATHLNTSATVQSAMESGCRSATEVMSALLHHAHAK